MSTSLEAKLLQELLGLRVDLSVFIHDFFDLFLGGLICVLLLLAEGFGLQALLLEVDQALGHGDFRGADLLHNFVDALTDEEFVGADFADGAPLCRLPRCLVLSRMWVHSRLLHALAVIGIAAKSAKDHLVSILENVMARRALLDRLLLAAFDGALPEEDGILVGVGMAAPAHHELIALLLEQSE